jgi:hypothetical protein
VERARRNSLQRAIAGPQRMLKSANAMVIWSLWRASRPRRVFEVHVRDDKTQVITGTVTQAFLQRIREVFASHGVNNATVFGVARGRRIALQFSHEIPEPACQQLRNWWVISGWGLGKPRANFGS